MDLAPFSETSQELRHFNVDTGATTYIVRDRKCITMPGSHRKQRIAVRTGSGTSFAESVGPATFLVLDDRDKAVEITRYAVFAPDFGVNLFSPAAEWDLHGGRVDFDDRLQLTLANGTRIPILLHGRSYRLLYATTPAAARATDAPAGDKPHQANALVASDASLSPEAELWHQRLGQLADIFTKALGPQVFHTLRQLILSAED
jgi:hypothetical protein